jgi:hypothetical protein
VRWGWRLSLKLFGLGVGLLVVGLAYDVQVDGLPVPVQDMGRATPEQLEAFYGRPPPLAIGLWWSGWSAVVGSAMVGLAAAGFSVSHVLRPAKPRQKTDH